MGKILRRKSSYGCYAYQKHNTKEYESHSFHSDSHNETSEYYTMYNGTRVSACKLNKIIVTIFWFFFFLSKFEQKLCNNIENAS